MSVSSAEATAPYRGLIAGYTDAIRVSDFKANICILFVAFMMGPIVNSAPQFPKYLPIPIVMLPFLIVYFCMLLVLIPRYPKRGKKDFVVSRNAEPDDFVLVESTEQEIEILKTRCAVLSGILFWKTLYLRTAFAIAMASMAVTTVLLLYVWL
jgi:hypothetical protein